MGKLFLELTWGCQVAREVILLIMITLGTTNKLSYSDKLYHTLLHIPYSVMTKEEERSVNVESYLEGYKSERQ